ncbi:MAG: DUF1254 domain-containing protein [Acidovorax sp.]
MTARPPLTEAEAYALGVEAYTYAYPMVLMAISHRVATNVAAPDGTLQRAPVNRFAHAVAYKNATHRDIVRPNADTLYSRVWFDLGPEPLVLTLPDTQGRYHVVPIHDMWTDVFVSLGTRTTGNGGGSFALVGPRWQGTLPEGVRPIVCPTEQGWILGRIQTNGPDDYGFVHRLQAEMTIVPLSAWGRQPHDPPPSRVDAALDMAPPAEQVARLSPAAFFALFAETLKHNPPHAADYAVLLRMERLGLVAGQGFDLAAADPVVRQALERAAPDAYQRIRERVRGFGAPRDGWTSFSTPIGVYGNDYLLRAFIAYAGLGALPNEEAIYPMAATDAEGQPLTGASRYVLHFNKDQLPPADAFWSLTMYGADQFFVPNPIDRYAIGDRDPLAYNADGSLDLTIQKDSPGKEQEANWLPAPAGPFSMNLRLYLPQAPALDGRWMPPALRRLP